MDQASSQYYSSPDVAASATGARNTVSERNRRKKLNDKLYALREAVPRISKTDVEEKDHLRLEIERAISALSGPYNSCQRISSKWSI
ncbi:hypothetical protein Peur_031362 [Populus x canadensis]